MNITKQIPHTTGITYYLKDNNISYSITLFNNSPNIQVNRVVLDTKSDLDDDTIINVYYLEREIIYSTY